jgi:hypothetical protein
MAKRRKPKQAQPPLMAEGRWTREQFKPPIIYNDRSKLLMVYNGSYGGGFHLAWYDSRKGAWRNQYGNVESVTYWCELPPEPERR